MVSASTIFNNLKTLLNSIYADKIHSHGKIDNNGKADVANGILTTDNSKNINVQTTISKNKINDFPTEMKPTSHTDTIGSYGKASTTEYGHVKLGTTSGTVAEGNHTHTKSHITDFLVTNNDISSNSNDKIAFSKLNITKNDITNLNIPAQDTYYSIMLTDTAGASSSSKIFNIRSKAGYKIYAYVKKGNNDVTDGVVLFVVNGVIYARRILSTQDGYCAALNINLDNAGQYEVFAQFVGAGTYNGESVLTHSDYSYCLDHATMNITL